jgi:HEPN domain-containing protein
MGSRIRLLAVGSQEQERCETISRIKEIEARMTGLLKDLSYSEPNLSTWMVREWIYFAQQYIEAASLLDDSLITDNPAKLQLSGHAVECAFKAFLLVVTQSSPKSHNLLELGKYAEFSGCHVTELQALAVLHLSLSYSIDIATNTRYKARYPTPETEANVRAIPSHRLVVELVESVISQVESNLATYQP